VYAEILKYRAFLSWSIRHERNASVAGSALGTFWSFLLPLTQIAIYYFLVDVIFARTGVTPYDPFLVISIGILHYTLFSQMVNASTNAILGRSNILLHKRVEPAVFVSLSFFKEARQGVEYLLIILLLYLFVGPTPGVHLIFYVPILALVFLFAWPISLALSVANVYYRDVANVVRVVLRITIYLSPVIYHFTFVPEKYWGLYFLNPIAGHFGWLQWSLLGGQHPPLWALAWSIGATCLAYAIGHVIYFRGVPNLSKRF